MLVPWQDLGNARRPPVGQSLGFKRLLTHWRALEAGPGVQEPHIMGHTVRVTLGSVWRVSMGTLALCPWGL